MVVLPWSWLPPVSKTDLSVLRLVNILALFCLAGALIRPDAGWLRGRIGRTFVLLGTQSLPVFAVGIVASVLGGIVFFEAGRSFFSHALVNLAGALAMLAVAWVAAWLRSEPWRSAAAGAGATTDRGAVPATPPLPESKGNDAKLALLLLLLALSGAKADPPSLDSDEQCLAPSEYVRFDADLAHARDGIREQRRLNIVALGSSTTQGAGSSTPGADYPSRLQTELSERLPGVAVTVWNRGVGGQTARDMLERLYTDAVDLGPQLVIWQTGVNDALNHVPVDQFADTLRQGIDVLREHGIDAVLMEMQYYPASARLPHYGEYLDALREVGREKQVPVFRRFDLMKYWLTSGEFEMDQLLSSDGLHMVDRSYYCLALELSDAIVAELR